LFLTNFDQFLRSNDPAICHYFVGLPADDFASKRPLTLHLFLNTVQHFTEMIFTLLSSVPLQKDQAVILINFTKAIISVSVEIETNFTLIFD
jgi:hypothetical protein